MRKAQAPTPFTAPARRRGPANWPALAAGLFLLLGLAACAAPPPQASPPPPPGQTPQKVTIRVLDAKDRPVVGAEAVIRPQAGSPRAPGPYLADARGEIRLEWLPEVRDELVKLHSRDQVYTFQTKLGFTIKAKGFLDGVGSLEGSGRYRSLDNPELTSMDNTLAMGKLSETVVLRRPRDLLGPGLSQRPDHDPLVASCLEFFNKYRLVAQRLGAEFAWPSFGYRGGVLTVAFDWRGVTWGGLKQAPLTAKVAVNSGVPLAVAAGKDLLPLKGVDSLAIEFRHELPPENDPRAAPRPAKVVLAAPAEQLRDLAQGRLTPDKFLLAHPPTLVVEPRGGDGS